MDAPPPRRQVVAKLMDKDRAAEKQDYQEDRPGIVGYGME